MSSIKDREDELYDFYGSMKEPSSVLKPILADHANARLLRCAAQRQVFVILRRSEKYEDGQVSIYDKVLVKLWVNEQTLQSMGLLSLFVREYLGGKIAKTAEEETAIVSGCIAAMEIVENGTSPRCPDVPTMRLTSCNSSKASSNPACAFRL